MDERLRQQRSRERRRWTVGVSVGGVVETASESVSRSGLGAEVLQLVRVTLEFWDRENRLSRAGLERKLLMGIRRSWEMVGQAGT